ncbi:16S rRNA (cytosine(1402)-N(4))-methyltransferase RsmH [Patescibacteria group bacterium]|nr:16S rRNA (cytosine(1402)-N(4))-methyltransferase RsmH [Patescibacteria group bacterium]
MKYEETKRKIFKSSDFRLQTSNSVHIPVLQKEVIDYLNPKSNENFIDCTIGEGGHTVAILKRNKPNGKVLGIEADPKLYQKLKSLMVEVPNPNESKRIPPARDLQGRQFSNRLILVNDSYTNLEKIVEKQKFGPISGILLDLGLSSWHLEDSEKGFSFLRDEPLDMRYNQETTSLTAKELINTWPQLRIEEILREYGEERYARRISKEIIRIRRIKQIKTTFQLLEVIKRAVPKSYKYTRTSSRIATQQDKHSTTRTFQAIRIAVNNELYNLESVLPRTLEVLNSGGRLVIISFHSLEDRIVKNFFKEKDKPHRKKYSYYGTKEGLSTPNRIGEDDSGLGPILKILTKKPIRPSIEEIRMNFRSRSAKLRAAIKLVS